MHDLPDIDARGAPAQTEKQPDQQQLPVVEQFGHTSGGNGDRRLLRFFRLCRFPLEAGNFATLTEITPTTDNTPSTAPPAKNASKTMTSGASTA